jgi:tetratricopeptide (TPR) repeat protein
MGRYDEAIEVHRSVLKTVPNHPIALSELEPLYYAKGMYEEALKFGKAFAAVRQLPGVEEAMVQGYEEAGYLGAYQRAAETLSVLSAETHAPTWLLPWYYAAAGQKQKALDWLERGVEEHELGPGFWDLLAFKTLHDEPRFQELLRRVNFPEDVIARILEKNLNVTIEVTSPNPVSPNSTVSSGAVTRSLLFGHGQSRMPLQFDHSAVARSWRAEKTKEG